MKVVTLSEQQFDKFSNNHRYRNYYQNPKYGRTMTKFGYNVQYLGFVNEKNKLIGATLLLYKEVFMSNKIAYAPRGLLIDYDDYKILKEITAKLKNVLSKQGFMLLRIDPYIPKTIRDNKGNIININKQADDIIKNLRKAGFKYKGENKFFETEKPRWESLIILNKSSSELYQDFDKRIKTKLKKAENSGIKVVKSDKQNVKDLYNMIKNKIRYPLKYYIEITRNYKNSIEIYYAKINTETFTKNSKKLYEEELSKNTELSKLIQNLNLSTKERNDYLNKKMESDKNLEMAKNNLIKATELLKNNPEGISIAGAMVILYDNAAYLYVDGLDEKYANVNANHLLKWELIKEYKKRNFKYINMNGIAGEFDKQHKYQGLNDSKLGYNSTVTEYIGEFDMTLNLFSYNFYKNFHKNK